MVGLTLLEEVGVLAGFLIFVLVLIVILRPLRLHITVKQDKDDEG